MNVKKIVAPLVLFCLFSCALVGSGPRIEGDTLTSEYPTLSIHFKKAIADVQEKGSDRVITFTGGDPRPMLIQLQRIANMRPNTVIYSLRQIAANRNHYYLGDIKFGEKEWAKTALYDGKRTLYCGYFTNKDNEFIYISIRNINLSKDAIQLFTEYKKTMTMPEPGLAIINEQFAYLDEVAEIKK